MELALGQHLGHPAPLEPRHNLAIEAIRAERDHPIAFTPGAATPCAHDPVAARRVAAVQGSSEPTAPPTPITPERPRIPGFPRLTADHPAHAPTGDPADDPIVLIREVLIYAPATLGVMLDLFA